MTATATDRARLVDIALASGWVVNDMGARYTVLAKLNVGSVYVRWTAEDGFQSLSGIDGKVLAADLTDQAEVVNLLRGERLHDAANARYFEVTGDDDLENADYRETDRHHALVTRSFLSHREAVVLAGPARAARSIAQVTGSRRATNVETVFGVELHVTWVRA